MKQGGFLTVETWSPEDTRAFGAALAQSLSAGDFLALDGELASGKTCLVQGLAAGLGCPGAATSPTFTLLHIYEGGRLPLYHFDVYRLSAPEELEGIGYEEYFYGDGVCAVEWSELTAAYLPTRRIGIAMERIWRDGGQEAETEEPSGKEECRTEGRRITVTPFGGDESWRGALLQRVSQLVQR